MGHSCMESCVAGSALAALIHCSSVSFTAHFSQWQFREVLPEGDIMETRHLVNGVAVWCAQGMANVASLLAPRAALEALGAHPMCKGTRLSSNIVPTSEWSLIWGMLRLWSRSCSPPTRSGSLFVYLSTIWTPPHLLLGHLSSLLLSWACEHSAICWDVSAAQIASPLSHKPL